jgi:hypothetical protein
LIQESEDYGWLSSFRDQHNATAGLPQESPERAAPIPMAPEVDETADWLRQYRARDSGITLGDLGFRHMPIDEASAMLELADQPKGPTAPGAEDIPYAGYGFALKDQAQALLAQARIQRGKATAEDERLYLSYLVDGARGSTFGGGVVDALYGIGTTGLEVAGGGVVAAAGKVAARKAFKAAGAKLFSQALEKGAAEATKRSLARAALETGAALGAATGLQEAVPQALGMEGGAWTLQSVQQLLGREMTDEEAQEIIDARNALVPVLLEQSGGLMDGLVRQSISMGVEGLGPVLGKLPVVSQIDLLTGMLFTKLAGKVGKGGWSKAVMEIAQQQGVGSEIAEEFADAILTASITGDKPIAQALLETAEQVPEFGSALLLLRGGMAGAQRAGAMLPSSGPKVSTAPVAQEGGASATAAPEAQAEGVAASVEAPTIAPEESAADLERFNRQTGAAFSIGTADRLDEFASQKLGGRFNLRVGVFVPEEGADLEKLPAAFFAGGDRAYVVRGQPGLQGAVIEEGIHAYIDQQPAERKDDLRQALREISPEFMDKVAAFTMSQPLYKNASPELLREEMAANAGTLLGNLTPYLMTPQGKADFELAYGAQPGPFKRALGALYDWIQGQIRLLPQRKRALARARLRVARGEGDPALVAQRVLEALGEIRSVKAGEAGGTVQMSPAASVAASAEPSGSKAPSAAETVAPRPPKTPAERRAARDARRGYGMPGALTQAPRVGTAEQQSQFDTQVARGRYGMPGALAPAALRRPESPPLPGDAGLEVEGADTSFDPADFDDSIQRDDAAHDESEREPSLYERLAQRTPAERRARPVTLLDHVLDLGGFDLRGTSRKGEASDVRDRILGMAGRNRSGIPSGLIRTHESTARGKGSHPDDMREALKERGFTGPDSDGRIGFDDMLDAIASELGGGRPLLSAESRDLLEHEAMREAGGLSGMDAARDFISDGKFAPRAPFIEVDGVQRPTTNSEGRPIHGTDEGLRAFWRWFGSSAVVDERGRPVVVYHGSRRPDRIGTKFDPKRATSGPMAFFTDSAPIGSNYATNKADTSLEAPEDYAEWFTYKPRGARAGVRIDQAWYRLSDEERAAVRERFSRVTVTDPATGEDVPVRLLPEGETAVASEDHWDYVMKREARGNPLRAMVEVWLNGGTLFDQEERFMELLVAAGVNAERLDYVSPHREHPGVIPAYLAIKNPLDTSTIDAGLVEKLRRAGVRKRGKQGEGADMWDKRHVSGAMFTQRLRDDIESGNTHAWTSVPDWVTDALRAEGFDGIRDRGGKMGGVGHSVWVPFQSNQIKSATGNRGTFDPASADIRFAPRAPQSVPTGPIGGEIPMSIDWFRQLLQDNTIALRDTPELRQAVKRFRPMLPDRLRRLEEDVRAMLRPFRGVADVEKLSRALYLTAAIQRNDWMLADRGVVDGAGITTFEAATELAKLRNDLTPARLDPFLAAHAAKNQERLDHLVETGIIPAAKAAEWAAREPNWVSMRELDPNADEHLGFGSKSMQVKNPQIRKAEGREFEAEHSLLAWYTEYATRMAFAEKNRALLVGARAGIPSVPKPRNVPGGFAPPDNYVAYLDNGQQHYLVMPDQFGADTLKGLDGDVTGLITDLFGKATRLFSRSVTGRNPTFWPINFLRDVPMAVIGSFVERDAAYAARVAARAPLVLPSMIRYQTTGNGAGMPWIEDAQRHGFKTTWADRRSMTEQLADFRAMIEGPRGLRAKLRATLRFVEAVGDSFEMATRYAVFETETRRQMRAGLSQEEAFAKAADYAREITINFDTKGSLTKHLGSYYAFFNPAVQGSARMVQLAISKRGAGIFGGIVAAGFLMEAANYALAPDDDETGLNAYGSLAEYEKNRNIVLPLWDDDGKATWKITLPYGVDFLWGLGRRMYLMGSGVDPRQTATKVVLDALVHASQSFSPLGEVSDPIAAVTPTVLKPIIEIDRNKKYGDRPVMPEATSFGVTKPDSARYFSTIDDRASGWIARHIANILNLGGPEELPTGLDVSPESVQHILEFFTAGFGLRDLDRLSEFHFSNREVSPAQTVPILRSFRAAVTSHYVSELYHEIKGTASTLHSLANDPENAERVKDIRARDERAWGLKTLIGRIDRQRSKLKKQLADAEGDEAHRIREEMTKLEAQVVGAYYRHDAADDRARLVGR